MKDAVSKFLNEHWDQTSPLLLGYSGGGDSKALLYAMLEIGVKPHLAHVDHGWREESRIQADEFKCEAEKLGIPFHTTRIESQGEDAARKGRLKFFHELFQKIPFQALLLGHHEKDLAETVLKRVFEGAHLPCLGGMQDVSEINGMTLFRPLLFVKKKEILEFLQERKLEAIHDLTNIDPKYLRARMRLEIFPHLSRLFGKEIEENLSLLSERSFELKAYLAKKTKGHSGPMADLERIEARYLLLEMAKKKNVTMTRAILERALDAIYSKRRNLRITESVFVNEGYVNLIPKQPEESVLAAPYPKDDASLGTPAAPYPKDDASLGTPAALALPHNFDSQSRLASRQWSLAPNQNSEEPPCQILDSSGCFGISD